MENQHDLERLRTAFQSIDKNSHDPEACPGSTEIWDAQKGDLGPEKTHEIIDHTASCSECSEAWRIAAEMAAPEATASEKSTSAKVVRLRWLTPASAFAVAAVLILALGVQFKKPAPSATPDIPFRDSTAEMDVRSVLPASGTLSRSNFALRWEHSYNQEVTFDIQVQTDDLKSVTQAMRLSEPRFVVPEALLAPYPSGTRLLWQVIVRVDGEQVKWSPTFVNVVE